MSSPLTDGENSVQIDAYLETLSFLQLVKSDQKCGFGIWRFAVAPSDAAEKNRKIGA